MKNVIPSFSTIIMDSSKGDNHCVSLELENDNEVQWWNDVLSVKYADILDEDGEEMRYNDLDDKKKLFMSIVVNTQTHGTHYEFKFILNKNEIRFMAIKDYFATDAVSALISAFFESMRPEGKDIICYSNVSHDKGFYLSETFVVSKDKVIRHSYVITDEGKISIVK